MREQLTRISSPRETKAAIACRLRHAVGRGGATAGEVEIENLSADVIEIPVAMHPLQYLSLVITDAVAAPVAAPPYGNMFSPREKPYLFRLAPGEKYTCNISLLGNLPAERQLPGSYTVRAVYEFNGLKAVSEPLQVEVPNPLG
jgi:hypothetical protein